MSLATREMNLFASGVRSRGRDYFALGFVTIETRTEDVVIAVVVNGSGGCYDVQMILDSEAGDVIDLECTCPYFDDHGECKHLWATILQVDAEDKEASAGKSRLSALRGNTPIESDSKPQPDWMIELRRLGSEPVETTDARTTGSTGDLILQSQLFWYVIDVSRSINKDSIAIDLMTQQFRASGVLGTIKEFRLDRNSVRDVKDPVHSALMQQLLDIGISNQPVYSYSYYSQPSFTTIDIKPLLQTAVLPYLARTGRLCWRLSAQVPMEDVTFLTYEENAVWEPVIEFVQKPAQEEWIITGRMLQNTFAANDPNGDLQQTRPLADMMLMTSAGIAVFPESLASIRLGDKEGWVRLLQRKPELRVSFDDHQLFLKQVLQTPKLLRMPLPADFCPQRQNARCKNKNNNSPNPSSPPTPV